jgi:hypothetical protein
MVSLYTFFFFVPRDGNRKIGRTTTAHRRRKKEGKGGSEGQAKSAKNICGSAPIFGSPAS